MIMMIITNNNFEHIVITSYYKQLIIYNYWYIDSSD